MDPHPSHVHPTAQLSPESELAPDVTLGPFAILEGHVRLGAGCIIGARAHLIGPLTMGKGNEVFTNAVLGERPQHLGYRDECTGLDIGDGNIFRENVTVHRGTAASRLTRIGSGNCFLAGSHVAHDCQVGDRCTFANNALLGGHCVVGDGARVGADAAVHQFSRLGRLAVLEAGSSATVDILPFIVMRERNEVAGVNAQGMCDAGLEADQVQAVRRVHDLIYRQGLTLSMALARAEEELGAVDVVREILGFVRASKRGIGRARPSDPGV